MVALLRYPKYQRRAIARAWAIRSNEAQAAARLLREPDFETQAWRAKQDARGMLVRHGCSYTATKETHWEVRRSKLGRTDQFDLVANGTVIKTAGPRKLPSRFRP